MKSVTVRGMPFVVHDDEDISNDIARNREYFEGHILDYVQSRFPTQKTILDIGAMIGNHTHYFARFFEYTKILAFEPMKEHFELLTQNTQNLPSVTTFNVAISSHTSLIPMQRHAFNWGMHGVKYPDKFSHRWEEGHYSQAEVVPSITIDSLGLDDVSLMKIDVELHEPFVLEGAQKTLQRCNPILMIEDCFNSYEDLLASYGYIKLHGWETNMEYIYIWEG